MWIETGEEEEGEGGREVKKEDRERGRGCGVNAPKWSAVDVMNPMIERMGEGMCEEEEEEEEEE